MSKHLKVSIVLPVYNGEKYISQAIESVLQQSYANWELIIVNDCSTDHTLEIVGEFVKKDVRICVYNNEINLKLPRALNVGFSKASGDYFTWISDDNYLRPNMIEILVETLDRNPDIGMVYSNYSLIDPEGRLINEVVLGEPHDLLYGDVCGPSFLYRRTVADKVGEYDSALFLAEDYDYWMRIYHEVPILHIQDNLYFYRKHDGSLTGTRRDKIISQSYRAVKKNYIDLLSRTNNKNEIYRLYDSIFWFADTKEQKCLRNVLYVSRLGHKWYHIKKRIVKEVSRLKYRICTLLKKQ